jgi:four helix bundle protein
MESILKRKSFLFAVDIVRFCDQLALEKRYAISNQLLRSGTSVGANISEAQFASSRADMIQKLKISEKEANETLYWIEILTVVGVVEVPKELKTQIVEIKKMLAASIKTLKASST